MDSPNCPKCGKKIVSEEKGSLTSYFFQGSVCQCNDPEKLSPRPRLNASEVLNKLSRSIPSFQGSPRSKGLPGESAQDEFDFCPRCGLNMVAASNQKVGSITGYLFQDLRCKCPPDPSFTPGRMTQALLALRESEREDLETTFSSEIKPGSRATVNLRPGAIIGGVYRIKFLIGAGGMGEVYLAYHTGLSRECALKLIPPERVTEIGWRRFQQEARAVGKLNHVNVVQVSDLGIHEGCLPFYAMEYVRGDNLADILKERLERKQPLPLDTILQIFYQVCDGVEYAHRHGIIHRDLKPANIMVHGIDSGKLTVKILDFGLAKLTQADRGQQSLTSVGDIFGSPYYMSPEQCVGGRIDNRSDLYSIGCTLFECLTGRPPFLGEPELSRTIVEQHQEDNAPELASVVGAGKYSDGLEILIAKALRKNPVERYQNIADLKADLKLVEHGETVQPYYMRREAGKTKSGMQAASVQSAGNRRERSAKIAEAGRTGGSPPAVLWRIVGISLAALIGLGLFGYFLYSSFKPDRPQPMLGKLIGEGSGVTDAAIKVAESKEGLGMSADLGKLHANALTVLHLHGTTYFQKQIKVGGALNNVYQFPKLSDTTLSLLEASADQEHHIGTMKDRDVKTTKSPVLIDEVTLPAGHHYAYAPSGIVFSHPELLEPFRDGDFTTLHLAFGDFSGKPPTNVVAPTKIFTNMHSVVEAWIEASVEDVEKIAVDILNQYPNIRRIAIHNNMTDEGFEHLVCLPSVEYLELDQPENNSLAFVLRRDWEKLKYLKLMKVRDVSPADLKAICSLPNLVELNFEQPVKIVFTDDQIAAFSRMPRLEEFSCGFMRPTPERLKILGHWRTLRDFSFVPGKAWSPEQLRQLERSMPMCKIHYFKTKINLEDPF